MKKILITHARLNDHEALKRLVAPLPDVDQLFSGVRSGFSGHTHKYDFDNHTAFYVVCDGEVITCYTVTDVALQQAAKIAAECGAIETWGDASFRSAVERALGVDVDLVH